MRQTEQALQSLRRCRNLLRALPDGDAELREAIGTHRRLLINGLTAISGHIIELALLDQGSHGLLEHPDIRPILLRLTPLALHRQKPGILVATVSKFACQASEYRLVEDKLGNAKLRKIPYATFFDWIAGSDDRFALFIDEEEEAFDYLLDALKRNLTRRDTDLHRVIYSFAHYFDLCSLPHYADWESEPLARRLFENSDSIRKELKTIGNILSKPLPRGEQLDQLATLACFAGFERDWLNRLSLDFFAKHDIENGFTQLKQKLGILGRIKQFVEDTIAPWPPGAAAESPFDIFRRLACVFFDKKQLMIDTRTLAELRSALAFLFFNERLEIYEHEVLEKVRLVPSLAHNALEMVLADSLDQAGSTQQRLSFSLGEFLKLFMLIARLILQTPIKKAHPTNARVTDHQRTVLGRFKSKTAAWKVDGQSLPLATQTAADAMLDVAQVFGQSKFALGIVEDILTADELRQREYSADMRPMSLSAAVLKRTPEELLMTALTRSTRQDSTSHGNLCYLISATGGLEGCWGGFNRTYLRERLAAAGGRLLSPTHRELDYMAKYADYGAKSRDIRIVDFQDAAEHLHGQANSLFRRLENAACSYLSEENNPHKITEIRNLLSFIARIAAGSERSGMAFTQSTSRLQNLLDRLAACAQGFAVQDDIRGLYRFDPATFGISGEPLRILLYSSQFGRETEAFASKRAEDADPHLDEEQETSLLEHLLDEREQKIVLVSSFKSASRGLNLLAQCHPKAGGQLRGTRHVKDFDAVLIAMSPYYDGLYRVPNRENNQIERLQAMLQYLYMHDRLAEHRYADLAALLDSEHELAFRDEYFRFIGRTMIQTVGRIGRIDGAPQCQTILLNAEIMRELAQFFLLEESIAKRLSAANRTLHRHVMDFAANQRMFVDEEGWAHYLSEELVLGYDFLRASRRIYRGFRNNACRDLWERIRDPRMFSDPPAYLASIETPPPGIETRHYRAFPRYAFIPRPARDLHLLSAHRAVEALPDAENRLGEQVYEIARELRGELTLYADLWHSRGPLFDPVRRLIPAGLQANPDFSRVMRELGITPATLFASHIPRPQFFNDYVKGYFAELVMERLLRSRGARFIDAGTHPKAAEIFEKFDLLIEGAHRIIAIDLKNWGRRSDRLNGRTLRRKAAAKTQAVEIALQIPIATRRKTIRDAQRVERLTGKTVRPLYINLYGERAHGVERLEGRAVHFYSLFVAEQCDDSVSRYRLNSSLMSIPELSGKDGHNDDF